jgi:SET domain-containing protein
MAWYINEPIKGTQANVACEKDSYEFVAERDISAGEELTVDYSTFSERLTAAPTRKKGSAT